MWARGAPQAWKQARNLQKKRRARMPALHGLSGNWVPRFVGGDFGLVFQRKSDVVEAFEQAVAGEVVDLEGGREAVVIVDFALLQVDGELVVTVFRHPANDL